MLTDYDLYLINKLAQVTHVWFEGTSCLAAG